MPSAEPGSGHITAIYRYPVKGLSPERLAAIELEAGKALAWDRAYAIENGSRDFDPENPQHFKKTKFLMLMRHERLASLSSSFEPATTTLMLARDGRTVARGDLSTPAGRAIVEQFLSAYMEKDLRGSPRIVHAPGFSHSDYPGQVISLINLASVRALEDAVGRPVDPLRFRGNIYLDGLEAWVDHDWVGKTLRLGEARLKGVMPTVRCAATNVDPITAERNMALPETLMRTFGHMNLGLYAEVVEPGRIAEGDTLTLE